MVLIRILKEGLVFQIAIPCLECHSFRRMMGRRMKSIKKWIYRILCHRYSIEYCLDDPEKLKKRTIYIIGENGYRWYAVMLCPCGCGEKLCINLIQCSSACWDFKDDHGIPSLYPSISRMDGCKSHFFITNGRINWIVWLRNMSSSSVLFGLLMGLWCFVQIENN